MMHAQEDYPKVNQSGGSLIDPASGYALDIPLGLQEVPLFWEQNLPLVERIRTMRRQAGVHVIDDMLEEPKTFELGKPEGYDEEIELRAPAGNPNRKRRGSVRPIERKDDPVLPTDEVQSAGRQSRIQDRARTMLDRQGGPGHRARVMLYQGSGNFGHQADPILEGWPEPEPLVEDNPEQGRVGMRADQMLEQTTAIPKSKDGDDETEEKGTPGVFPAQLKKYWLGKGLSRWANTPTPYRSLVAALRKEGVAGHMVKGLAARLYHWHFGKWPGKNSGKKSFTPQDSHAAMVYESKCMIEGRSSV